MNKDCSRRKEKIMALSNLNAWASDEKVNASCGTACGAEDKPEETPAACGAADEPTAACGAQDEPKGEAPAACGAADEQKEEVPAACGASDTE